MKSKTILQEAQEIIFERSEEKQREYGPIDKSMEDAAAIASILTGKRINPEDMYKCMMALKLARYKKNYKRDTHLDLVGYAGALAAYEEKRISDVKKIKVDYDEEQ